MAWVHTQSLIKQVSVAWASTCFKAPVQPQLKITTFKQAGNHLQSLKKSQPQNKCKPDRVKDSNMGNSATSIKVKYLDL